MQGSHSADLLPPAWVPIAHRTHACTTNREALSCELRTTRVVRSHRLSLAVLRAASGAVVAERLPEQRLCRALGARQTRALAWAKRENDKVTSERTDICSQPTDRRIVETG